MELIKVRVVEKSKLGTKYKAGDRVTLDNYGAGIIVGFSEITGNPMVYFWDHQGEGGQDRVLGVSICSIRPAPAESETKGEMQMEHAKYCVVETSKKDTEFKAGDRVTDDDFGAGIIVGFSEITGNPMVYFYDSQHEFNDRAVCVDITTIRPTPAESEKGGKEMSINIKATLDITNLDDVLEKTTRITELLQEAQQIIESLSREKQSSPEKDLNILRSLSEAQAQELFQRSQEETDEGMTVREMLEKQLQLLSEQDMIALNVSECCQLNAAICETAKVLMDAITRQL